MTEQKWPRIQCWMRDFGPIREGSFDLAPLTVFIGPNGSGKTYAATLAYLFGRSLWATVTIGAILDIANATLVEGGEVIVLPDMLRSPSRRKRFQSQLVENSRQVTIFLERQVPQYFSQESVDAIIRRGSDSLEIGVRAGEAPLQISGVWQKGEGWQWVQEGFDRIRLRFARSPLSGSRPLRDLALAEVFQAFQDALGFPESAYYFPAARAGLLQGWRTLAAMAIRIVRREIGLKRIEATPYTGVAGDFLLTLAEEGSLSFSQWWKKKPESRVPQDEHNGRDAVLRLLEGEILRGHIDWLSPEDPQLLLFQRGMQVPLTAISSGLAELAPLDLLLRRKIIGPGDWLIIEEPEAHLHPENQRRIATLMVRLVRWGVRVLCTTHSDIILHQLSNHLLLGEALEKGRRPEGFDPEWDRLGYDEVGVYLFRLEDDGAVIEPVVPEPGFGIPEEEFVRVAEALGSQTYDLLDLISE